MSKIPPDDILEKKKVALRGDFEPTTKIVD
jgi:hypothetical protein